MVEDAAAATASLRGSLAEVSGKIEANRKERAQIELEDGASASALPAQPGSEGFAPPQEAAEVASGLWQQFEALPAVLASGNANSALAAMRQQLQGILARLPLSQPTIGRPPGTEAAVRTMVAEARQERRRRACSADDSDGRRPSRSRSGERGRREDQP